MKSLKICLVLNGRATVVKDSNIWIKNFYDTFVELGHDVTLINIVDFINERDITPDTLKAKEFLSSELPLRFRKLNQKKKFDIFFSYLHNGQIYPAAFHEIKKEGVFTVNYTTNFHQFPMYEEIAKLVDLNIYASRIARQGFEQVGAKSYYMPFAANESYYKPKGKRSNEIVFIGSTYGVRPYYLWRTLQNGVNMNLYGPGWNLDKLTQRKRIKNIYNNYINVLFPYGRNADSLYKQLNYEIIKKINQDYSNNIYNALSDEEYVYKLGDVAISINFNESRFNHDYNDHRVLLGCNLRDFENTMSGAFSLTQYSDELYTFFEEGNEVVSFKNEYELADKLKYYTQNSSERAKIALAGYERAIREHTWKARFEVFFSQVSR